MPKTLRSIVLSRIIFLQRLKLASLGQFVVFKPLSYCFEETVGFDVKAKFARPPVSRLIKPRDITKEF